MNKLFIIGNGFDIAHKIESSYEHFRQYLITLLENVSKRNYKGYDFTDNSIITSDYTRCPENDLLTILYFISNAEYLNSGNTEWKYIEKSVGELSYDDFSWLYVDESADDKEYRANWINEDIFSPYIEILTGIPKYFEKWVKQVDMSNIFPINDLKPYFDSKTVFLSFNYTDTLEKLYDVNKKDICYIHGNARRGEHLYFGHGNDLTYDDYINSIDNSNYFSVADGYSLINDVLRKPVSKIIKEKIDFFKGLGDIQQVYSYGFSYSSVDEAYIRKVCEYLPPDAEWYINSFPAESEKECYRNVIKRCGYKGIIKEFL